MAAQVLVLGGGVGGTMCANVIAKRSGGRAHVTVVDATGIHVFQPGFLYVAVGQERPSALQRSEASLLRHDVRLVVDLSLIHISEPTRLGMISYAVFCLKK